MLNTILNTQYNAAHAITAAIKGTSQSKLYSELGFEYLKFRHLFRKFCTFFKLKTSLFDLILQTNHLYNSCLLEDVTTFYSRTDAFKYFFSPSTILEWNKLDRKVIQQFSNMTFRNSLLKIDRPAPKPVCNVHNPNGLKLLTRLRLGFSHLYVHVLWRLNPFPIFFCTVIISLIFNKPFYYQLIKIF